MLHHLVAADPGGPEWLELRRRSALEALADADLPSTDAEVWRYSRIDELDLDAFGPAAGGTPDPAGARGLIDALGTACGVAVLVDGRVAEARLDDDVAARGVRFGRAADVPGADEVVGRAAAEPVDVFALFNDAASDPVVLDVPRGVVLPRPVVVVDWSSASGVATAPRLAVRLGEDSEATVVEVHAGADVLALSAPVTELAVGRAARLRHVLLQHRGPRAWQVGGLVATVEADATLVAQQAALGGDYGRSRIDCRLDGRGATGRLAAAYFGERSQMLDFRTFQDHRAPDTTSELLFKGAVAGSSRAVYTGLIHVGKEARGTNAFQTNRNLKLSDGAWAESVPNLEIENNDVRCSHASTVGPVDPDQRFYLEARGVPTAIADRLVVAGFFAEVLDALASAEVAELARAEIGARLDRTDDGVR